MTDTLLCQPELQTLPTRELARQLFPEAIPDRFPANDGHFRFYLPGNPEVWRLINFVHPLRLRRADGQGTSE